MKLFTVFAFAVLALSMPVSLRADDKELKGPLLKLVGDKKELATEVGGLILVPIPDSGSRPPSDIKVEADKLKKIGSVYGSQNEDGIPTPGGGYTWALFTAEKEGEYTVKISYTQNDEKKTKVEKTYKVKVSKAPK